MSDLDEWLTSSTATTYADDTTTGSSVPTIEVSTVWEYISYHKYLDSV